MNRLKLKTSKTVVGSAALAIPTFLALLPGQTGLQQGVVTSSTRVVVVLIPGFPIESIGFGVLLGMIAILFRRRRRTVPKLDA